jgi:hypothetical protein
MVEVIYGAKNFAALAWKEIAEGRPVVVNVTGWHKAIVHRVLSLYAQHDELVRRGGGNRGVAFKLGWRSLFAPSIVGLCNHARIAGMGITVKEKGAALEVRFEKPEPEQR